jgi:HemX protein
MMTAFLLTLAYAAAALYLLSALLALRYLWSDNSDTLKHSMAFTGAGAVVFAALFATRWASAGRVPLTSMLDSLVVFVLLSTVSILFVLRNKSMRALLCFYLPPLAGIALTAAAIAHQYLPEAPRDLHGVFLVVHVGLAQFAFALFFIASMTSAAYLFQSHNLKQRRTQGLFAKLPSLEQLDATLYALIGAGYPLFIVTLFLGIIWAWIDRDLLGPYWFLSPKVLLALVMAIFYSLTFHTRRFGKLRGPKLATLVFGGFVGLLGLYLVLGLMQLNNYFFWGNPS